MLNPKPYTAIQTINRFSCGHLAEPPEPECDQAFIDVPKLCQACIDEQNIARYEIHSTTNGLPILQRTFDVNTKPTAIHLADIGTGYSSRFAFWKMIEAYKAHASSLPTPIPDNMMEALGQAEAKLQEETSPWFWISNSSELDLAFRKEQLRAARAAQGRKA